jgi:hypothetical protein
MPSKFSSTAVILSSVLLLGAAANAQSPSNGSQQPLPPLSPLGPQKTVGDGVTPGDSADAANQQTIPDTHTLAGAQELTLGTSASAHNFILPSFSVMTQMGTNPFASGAGATTHPATLSTSYLSARLGLNRISERSEFLLDYLVGGSFSNDSSQGDSLLQNLEASETVHSGRWSILFGDQFSYLSDSIFGYGGVGGLQDFGVSLGNGVGSSPGISSSFVPNQSIYIDGLPRINNTGLGQMNYALSHRSSLTFVGAYGIQNFRKSPLQDSNVATFQGGYDYLLSRQNSVSFFYRFDNFAFSNLPQGTQVHSVQAAFARRITGRLAWSFGGGPSIQIFQNPLTGPGTIAIPTAFTDLKYQLTYTRFTMSYTHGITNGSGISPGALTDTFSGKATRTLGKNWAISLQAGFSRNDPLQQTLLRVGSPPEAWFTTSRISRRFVGYGEFFLQYIASGQSSLYPFCTLPACSINTLTSTGSVGYTWGLRPTVLE